MFTSKFPTLSRGHPTVPLCRQKRQSTPLPRSRVHHFRQTWQDVQVGIKQTETAYMHERYLQHLANEELTRKRRHHEVRYGFCHNAVTVLMLSWLLIEAPATTHISRVADKIATKVAGNRQSEGRGRISPPPPSPTTLLASMV